MEKETDAQYRKETKRKDFYLKQYDFFPSKSMHVEPVQRE